MTENTNLLLQGHQGEILTIKYNNSGSVLASGGMDRNVFLWSPSQNYQNVSILKSHTNAITSLAFSSQDVLFSASADKTVAAWNIEYEKLLRKYKNHNGVIHSVSAPKKSAELMASVGDDNIARIWDQRSKQEVFICKTKYPLTSCTFSINGNKLYVGGIDNQIKVINISEQKIQQVISGHQDTISSLEISPDGTFLMSNSFDETIKIWDVRANTLPNNRYSKTLTGHLQGGEKGLIRGAWSHDGLYLSCGSIDKCVYIWDVNTRKIVQKLGGHTGTINQADMSFINKKSHLATGSNDKSIIVSELPDIFL